MSRRFGSPGNSGARMLSALRKSRSSDSITSRNLNLFVLSWILNCYKNYTSKSNMNITATRRRTTVIQTTNLTFLSESEVFGYPIFLLKNINSIALHLSDCLRCANGRYKVIIDSFEIVFKSSIKRIIVITILRGQATPLFNII